MNLLSLGFSPVFKAQFQEYEEKGFIPARVIRSCREIFSLVHEYGEVEGELSGKLRFMAESAADLPAVGDWTAVMLLDQGEKALIHALLKRKSQFSRNEAGPRTQEQIIAANIDTVFLVTGLDGNFNARRIERYLTQVWNSGANPVILLNKSDLCEDPGQYLDQIQSTTFGVPIFALSALENEGMDVIHPYLQSGQTVVFIGSSGVGKSTIINRLLGQEMLKTQNVRETDSRGRHTTTHRELFFIPNGAAIIDSPGMRELQIWSGQAEPSRTFQDIEDLAAQCRFNDCTHRAEPGCAIIQALESGDLDPGRWENYVKQLRELRFHERRVNAKAAQLEKDKWKKIHMHHRRNYNAKRDFC